MAISPAKLWREQIRRLFGGHVLKDESELYERIKQIQQELKEDHRESKTIYGPDGNLFINSIAMLAFGHLEAMEDILENYSGLQINAKSMIVALYELLPLPHHPFDVEKTQEWFQAHRDHLVWSEEQGKFLLTE